MEIDQEAGYTTFKVLELTLALLVQTRMDIAFAVGQLSQVSQQHFESDSFKHRTKINKAVRHFFKDSYAAYDIQNYDQKDFLYVSMPTDHKSIDDSSLLGNIIALSDA